MASAQNAAIVSFACAVLLLLLSFYQKKAAGFQIGDPSIGVYQINFKDEIVKVFSEERNREVVLPVLQQSYYTETTFKLVCNATYPVQWVFSSTTGTPTAIATTLRIAPDHAVLTNNGAHDIFQARVTFSFMRKSQEGNYTCERIAEPAMASFVYLKVENSGTSATGTVNTKFRARAPGAKASSNLRMRLIQSKSDRVICCSPKPNDFLKIRFMKCSSVSDCGLKQVYMENNRNCTQHYCSQDRVTRTQDEKETCSMFDMGDDYAYDSLTDADEASNSNSNTEYQQGIFQCSSGDDAQSEYLTFTRLHDNSAAVSDYSKLPSPLSQILRIETEETRRGAEVFLTCNTNSFFFSQGLKWAFQYSNQSEYTFYDKGEGKVSLRFPKSNLERKIVHCFAPVWNSVDWKSTSVLI